MLQRSIRSLIALCLFVSPSAFLGCASDDDAQQSERTVDQKENVLLSLTGKIFLPVDAAGVVGQPAPNVTIQVLDLTLPPPSQPVATITTDPNGDYSTTVSASPALGLQASVTVANGTAINLATFTSLSTTKATAREKALGGTVALISDGSTLVFWAAKGILDDGVASAQDLAGRLENLRQGAEAVLQRTKVNFTDLASIATGAQAVRDETSDGLFGPITPFLSVVATEEAGSDCRSVSGSYRETIECTFGGAKEIGVFTVGSGDEFAALAQYLAAQFARLGAETGETDVHSTYACTHDGNSLTFTQFSLFLGNPFICVLSYQRV